VILFVLGGAALGKSKLAEQVAATLPPPVTYVATYGGDDPGMRQRIAAHRARRPPHWHTIELGPRPSALADALATTEGSLLVDALGTWLAGHDNFDADVDEMVQALTARPGDTVVVSDEVGLSVHPPTDVGVRFRDALGAANQAVSAAADRVWLVVAGRIVELEAVSRPPW
jgi:adenosylcobinamide kinase/adenosylcobinamide-phosphate guanylyltransferase